MAINAGSIYSTLELRADNYFNTLSKAEKQSKSFSAKLEQQAKKMESVGKNMTKKVTAPIVAMGTASLKIAADFEQSMSKVSALSGATGQDLQNLEDKAREMGSQTAYSASEAAEAMQYMSLAGWDADQMMAGIEDTLYLAGAAGLDLGIATDIVTDSLSMFGMEADEAARMTDVLAYAQANSNTDVEQLSEALIQAGASANAMGYDIEDTAALLGIFADQGLKGGAAGTTLNRMFVDMKEKSENGAIAIGETNVAIVDAEGNYRDMAEILSDVEDATEGMTQAQKDQALASVFGTQAIKGVNMILAAGTDELKEFEEGIRNSDGAAKEMYDTMQNNLKGSFEKLKSAISEAALSIGQALIPMIENVVETINNWVNKFNELDEGTQAIIVKSGLLLAAIGPLIWMGAKVAGGVTFILGKLGLLSGGIGLAATATAGLTAAASALPFVAVGAALVGVIKIGSDFVNHLRSDAIPEVELFGEGVSEATAQAVGGFMDLEEKASIALLELNILGGEVTEEMKETIGGNFTEMTDTIVGETERQRDEQVEVLNDLFANSQFMSEEDKEKTIATTVEKFEEQIRTTEAGNSLIQGMLNTAAEENRELNETEKREINRIKEQMKEDAVRVLSESELEQMAIMERLKAGTTQITAKQTADIVKSSYEAKEGSVKAAEEKYDEQMKIAAQLRSEGTEEAIAAADEIVFEAERQKRISIKEAEDMHKGVIKEAKEQAKGHVNEVDWETGEVLSKWKVFGNNMSTTWGNIVTDTKEYWSTMAKNVKEDALKIRDDATEKAKETWTNVTTAAREGVESASTAAREVGEGIKTSFNSAVSDAKEWGSNIVEGIRSGLNSAKDSAVTAAKNVGSSISRGFKSVLEIFSPSRVFMRYGEYIAEGAALGIEKGSDKAEQASKDMGRKIVGEYDRLGDAIMTGLKNRYREEESLQRRNLTNQTDRIRREVSERIRIYDDEYQAKLKTLDAETNEEMNEVQKQIDAIHNKTKEEEKAMEEQEYQKRLADKKKSLQEAKSSSEREKIQEELDQMLADRQRKHLLEQRNKQVEALRAEMKNIQTQAKDKEIQLTKEHEKKVTAQNNLLLAQEAFHEKESIAISKHYGELLKEENLQAEARYLMLDENNEELIDLLETYNPQWQNAGQSFGESLLTGLNSMKSSIQAEVNSILSMVGQDNRHHLESDSNRQFINTEQNRQIINAKKQYESAKKAGDSKGMNSAMDLADKMRKQGGTIGSNISLSEAEKRIRRNAHGTDFFTGGYSWVGEQGPEIVELPKGSKVHSHEKSKLMAGENSKGITQNITIKSPEPLSPSQTARQIKNASKKLALEWR